MQQFDQLIQANFYHVYNHGVGGRDLFSEPENYRYFMSLYEKYIGAFAIRQKFHKHETENCGTGEFWGRGKSKNR